ncbi:hypothetical protein D3C72_1331430 [compost metagenome]
MIHPLAQVGNDGLFVRRLGRPGQVFRPATLFRAEEPLLLVFFPAQDLPGSGLPPLMAAHFVIRMIRRRAAIQQVTTDLFHALVLVAQFPLDAQAVPG